MLRGKKVDLFSFDMSERKAILSSPVSVYTVSVTMNSGSLWTGVSEMFTLQVGKNEKGSILKGLH